MAKQGDRTTEELQQEIALVELETKKLSLEAARRQNEEFRAAEERRRLSNQQRMAELAEGRRARRAVIDRCRHKSGGTPQNILRGGGVGSFSLITRALMPDGVTILLQCPRCRMMEYPPSKKLKKEDPEQYKVDLERYNNLLELSIEDGLQHAESRGPTFLFQQEDGTPFVPDRV